MNAARLFEYVGQLVFGDVPKPAIAHDEVLVKVREYSSDGEAAHHVQQHIHLA